MLTESTLGWWLRKVGVVTVAQNLPVVAKLAEHNPNIDLRIILRDENLDLMDEHLTDGGRSIPSCCGLPTKMKPLLPGDHVLLQCKRWW